jgi:transglutaminase/protease-like cytokinesis protein 3
MGKFLQMMSQNDSKALVARASQINVQAKIAQQAIVQNLKNEIANVEIEIQNLTDFAPDTTQSLRPGVKGWNPTKWASDLQEAKTRLYELNIELKIAEATEKEFFGDEDTDIVAE